MSHRAHSNSYYLIFMQANLYKSMNSTATSNDNDTGTDAILGAFSRLRQVAAFAKVDAAVALAKSVLQVEPSVVIFTYFVDVAKEVQAKLESAGWTGETLTGETPSAKRQSIVDNFQVRPSRHVLRVCTAKES